MRRFYATHKIPPGEQVTAEKADSVLNAIAETALDLFGTFAGAVSYIRQITDDTEFSALELIKQGRTSRIFNRLNDLRFGSRG